MNVLLLFGGISPEHEVSVDSARNLYIFLQKSGFSIFPVYIDRQGSWFRRSGVDEKNLHPAYLTTPIDNKVKLEPDHEFIDVVFNIIHGSQGEDGRLQGLCESLRIPIVGPGVLTSAICMDKGLFHALMTANGIPSVENKVIYNQNSELDLMLMNEALLFCEKIGYPVFIKPANAGSSVGISKVKQPEELNSALSLAFQIDSRVLIEKAHSVREIETAILGNYPNYEISEFAEIIPQHEFYTYEAKYQDKNGAKIEIPAKLTSLQKKELTELSKKAFKLVQGDGFARIDFFIDQTDNQIYLNEINTLTGFTPISMFTRLWEEIGISNTELMKKIIELAIEKSNAIYSL